MNDKDKALKKLEDVTITERNWLMLKEIEKGKSIRDAYYAAGYKCKDYNGPYEFYHGLRKKLEQVYEADNIDSLRLKIAAKKILDMKVEDKPVKPETHLKAIETLAKLTESKKTEQRTISPFIVFKTADGKIQASEGKVVEAMEIKEEDKSD